MSPDLQSCTIDILCSLKHLWPGCREWAQRNHSMLGYLLNFGLSNWNAPMLRTNTYIHTYIVQTNMLTWFSLAYHQDFLTTALAMWWCATYSPPCASTLINSSRLTSHVRDISFPLSSSSSRQRYDSALGVPFLISRSQPTGRPDMIYIMCCTSRSKFNTNTRALNSLTPCHGGLGFWLSKWCGFLGDEEFSSKKKCPALY